MSLCTVCLKDSKEHSEKLWEMHQSAIQKALKKTRHKKLWTKKMGFGPDCPAVLDNDFSQYHNSIQRNGCILSMCHVRNVVCTLEGLRKRTQMCWTECV